MKNLIHNTKGSCVPNETIIALGRHGVSAGPVCFHTSTPAHLLNPESIQMDYLYSAHTVHHEEGKTKQFSSFEIGHKTFSDIIQESGSESHVHGHNY